MVFTMKETGETKPDLRIRNVEPINHGKRGRSGTGELLAMSTFAASIYFFSCERLEKTSSKGAAIEPSSWFQLASVDKFLVFFGKSFVNGSSLHGFARKSQFC